MATISHTNLALKVPGFMGPTKAERELWLSPRKGFTQREPIFILFFFHFRRSVTVRVEMNGCMVFTFYAIAVQGINGLILVKIKVILLTRF